MPKHIEGVFGQALCPKDAIAIDRRSTLTTDAVLLCPLSIIVEVSSTA
jgi:hypothetical protein